MIGMDQTDIIYGGKGNDILLGEGGTDFLYGNEGDDILHGGDGIDLLNGGSGNDTLYGGEGNDIYIVNADEGTDKIEDKQGNNKVILCGIEINFFYDAGAGQYASPDGTLTGVMSGGDFIVTGPDGVTQVILNEDFQWGDFGIILLPSQEEATIGSVIYLDVEDPDHINHRGVPYGTDGNDQLIGGGGHDEVFTVYGQSGNDWLMGGAGNDMVQAFGSPDDCILEGNSGVDAIFGGNGNDRIYGEDKPAGMTSYEEMTFLIAAGEIAASIEARGDALSGGGGQIVGERQVTDGDDYLYGSNAGDVLMGGTGKDLIVGGGGNDVILGDKTYLYNHYELQLAA